MKKKLINTVAIMMLSVVIGTLKVVAQDCTAGGTVYTEITSISPSNGRVCPGAVFSVTFTFNGPTPYSATLYGGSGYNTNNIMGTATNIYTSTYTFTVNVPDPIPAGFAGILDVVVQPPSCDPIPDGQGVYQFVSNLKPQVKSFIVANGVCSNPTGYQVGLTAKQSGITYTMLIDGVAQSTTPTNYGSGIIFGTTQTAVGNYQIKGLNSAGCYTIMDDNLTIKATPSVPTVSYKYCTSDSLFNAYALSTVSTGTINYYWKNNTSNVAQSATSLNNFTFVRPSPHNNDNVTVFATANSCSSATATFPNPILRSTFPTPYILEALYTDTSGNGHLIPNPGLNSVPALKDQTGWANSWSLISDQLPPPNTPAQTTFQWYVTLPPGAGGTTIPLSGQTTTYIEYYKRNTNEGVYFMKMTNTCGTASTGSVNIHYAYWGARKGLDAPYEGPSSFIYPNPTSGDLNINSPYDDYILSVTNLLGSEVLSKQVNQTSIQVDLSSLSAGSYVVKLVSAQGTVTKKVQVVK